MKVVGEMNDVLIRLAADERVCQFIDIMVVNIPEAYGLILSRDWSAKLNGYSSIDWSHLWFPYNNYQNHIKVMREPHMKYIGMQLQEKNETVNFLHNVLGNYLIELETRNSQVEEANDRSDTQPELLQFSRADKIDCNIVNLVSDVESSTSSVELADRFWVLYFDGSKNQEGLGAGYILIDLENNCLARRRAKESA